MAELPVTLSMAGSREVVTVSSEAELVETSRTSTTDTVSRLFTNAGQATSSYDPRQFQFALKFNW
jgi:hypothetical protein